LKIFTINIPHKKLIDGYHFFFTSMAKDLLAKLT